MSQCRRRRNRRSTERLLPQTKTARHAEGTARRSFATLPQSLSTKYGAAVAAARGEAVRRQISTARATSPVAAAPRRATGRVTIS
jgi:hypothetical protein